MKPIIMDIRDISLSKEVYDKRPRKFFAIFIYGLLFMLLIAFLWSYFGRFDMVIRTHGILRPHAPIAMITNPNSGEVRAVSFYESMRVNRGDILYIIDTFHLESEKGILKDQLELLQFDLISMQLYLESIESGRNLVGSFNEELGTRLEGFFLHIDTIDHDTAIWLDSLQQEYASINNTLERIQFERSMLRILESSIVWREDMFENVPERERSNVVFNTFRNQYSRYIMETMQLKNEHENLQNSLAKQRVLLDSIINDYDMFEYDCDYRNQFLLYVLESRRLLIQKKEMETSLDGYKQIRDSILFGVDLFSIYEVISTYRNMHSMYLLQLQILSEVLRLAEERHQTTQFLFDAGAVPFVEVQSAITELDTAAFAIKEYTSSFMAMIEDEISNYQRRITQIENQIETSHMDAILYVSNQIRNIETQIVRINNQLDVLHTGTMVSISEQLMQLYTAIDELTQLHQQIRLQQNTLFLVYDEIGDTAILRLNEANMALQQINVIEPEITRLKANIDSISVLIEESVVRTPICGIVNVHIDLMDGSFLVGGVHVLSIIPVRYESLIANLFINNHDIGQIEEGMIVRYDIPALPRRDFGDITGEIIRIAPDIIYDSGHFLVESMIEDRVYYDALGNGVELRVGMGFEARIVVGRERIIHFLLDQLNLRFH